MEQPVHANFPAVASAWQLYSEAITMGKDMGRREVEKGTIFYFIF
jgi:hypothetical protein